MGRLMGGLWRPRNKDLEQPTLAFPQMEAQRLIRERSVRCCEASKGMVLTRASAAGALT